MLFGHTQGVTNSSPTSTERPAEFRSLYWLVVRYLRDNPVAGLRAGLSGAPVSTWSLVPGFVVITLIIGLTTGQLQPQLPDLWRALWLPPLLIVFPTLVEEFFHRGILLPRSLLNAGPGRRFMAATASTAVYVSVHPISPLLGRSDLAFFLDPWMLVIVAVLGYTSAYAYLRSGSLRAPILIHWATVVVWNLFMGGIYSG